MTLRQEILEHVVPAGKVTLWWLGQAGMVIKTPGGKIAVIDPYLTNSCKALGDQFGFDMDRLLPAPLAPADLVGVDVYAITHSHGDHLDPETLAGYRDAGGKGPFLAPPETAQKLKELGVPEEQIIMTWPNKTYQVNDLLLRTTFALPFGGDDLTHVGYLAGTDGGPTVYTTGDTGYHEVLAASVRPHRPDILFAVINPAFRNMSPIEAARLAKELDVKVAIPCHYDVFPCNSLPPELFRTNLKIEGIGERYLEMEHGVPFTFPNA